jgi:hypothetical protein
MKKLFAVFAISMLASSCSVFTWLDEKTDEWGRSLPVSNEARRCANAFCSERDYQNQAQQSAPQVSAMPQQVEVQPMMQQAQPQMQNNMAPTPQLQLNSSPAGFPSQRVNGYQGSVNSAVPVAYNAPQANYQMPMPQMQAQPMQAMPPMQAGQMLTPEQFMAMQKANPNMPLPGEDDMSNTPPGMPNPYEEAARDPRLNPNEADPDWKKKLPPLPENMRSMQSLQ